MKCPKLFFCRLFPFDGLILPSTFPKPSNPKKEQQFEEGERKREEWEVDVNLEGEKREVEQILVQKGLSNKDAKKVVNLLATDRKTFLEFMLVTELGILSSDQENAAWKNGLVTFASFIMFGCLPLILYLIAIYGFLGADASAGSSEGYAVWGVCIAVSVLTLFLLGSISGRFSHQPWWRSGLTITVIGVFAAGVSYGIGVGVSQATGVAVGA